MLMRHAPGTEASPQRSISKVERPDAPTRMHEYPTGTPVFLDALQAGIQIRSIRMKRTLLYAASAIAMLASPLAAQSPDSTLEFAFMPSNKTVILLNEGGKYIAIDMKHIAQGETCRMNKDATIIRVGSGAGAGMVRVRYAAGQVSSGGCPFMTMFDLPEVEYLEGRAAFLNMKEEAWRKIDQIKKDLGEKWDEMIGKKS
jgi:hypothetical protein